MSTSLLLALLETQGNEEPDYSKEYDQWARGDPYRKKLMLDALYEVLQSTMDMRMSASGALGTVLARTLSNEQKEGLADAKLHLRGELRYELIRRFNALKEQYPSGPSSGSRGMPPRGSYPGSLTTTPPLEETLHNLVDVILQSWRRR